MAKVEGLERFQRRLAAVPKKARDELRKALELSADEMVAHMKRIVRVETGDAQMSISWTWGDAPKGAVVLAKSKRSAYSKAVGAAGMSITIYAGGGDAFHARFLEFGTVKMMAKPFFFPTWRIYKKRAKSRIGRATRKAVKVSV